MKKILFLFALLLTVSAQAKDKVINQPAFVSNTAMWELRPLKIELTKKATIVHFYVVNAKWGEWRLVKAQLVAGGDTLAFKSGRIITHDGTQVLTEEPFELGKQYEKNVQRDSLILSFESLPKGTKTFDCLTNNGRRNRNIKGIRCDDQLYPALLPPYQPLTDDGQPLKPLTMGLGELSATIRVHGGGKVSPANKYANIWGKSYCCSNYDDSLIVFRRPAYLRELPFFTGNGFGLTEYGFNNLFPLVLIPGETLTLDIDLPAITARDEKLAGGKIKMRDCYRVGGTIGDINQVLLENQELMYARYHKEVIPECSEGESFPEWSEQLWQNFESYRQKKFGEHPDYTRRQKEFLTVWLNDLYVCYRHNYANMLKQKMDPTPIDSLVTHLSETYTLADSHIKDMLLYRDGRAFYMPAHTDHIPYLEANGLGNDEVCKTLKALDYKQQLLHKLDSLEVLSDEAIGAAHPLFQTPLREYNDSIRLLKERIQHEAIERIMPTPNVSGDKLVETIASQYPGNVVFFDLWATWCGPCRRGIEAMEPLKEKLKGRDVVFIYLTDESSPEAEWKKQVANMPGLHYRISSLSKQIPGVSVIPQYYLYDRQGKRVWEQVGFDDEVLKIIEAEIEKALRASGK